MRRGAVRPSGAPAASGVTLLRAARLFDGTAMRAPGVLVLRGDRIVSLNAGDAGSDATVIDLADATLLPGLIDAHTHRARPDDLGTRLDPAARSATSHAADMIGTKDRGRLAPGLLADVVGFNDDPSANTALLEKPPALSWSAANASTARL